MTSVIHKQSHFGACPWWRLVESSTYKQAGLEGAVIVTNIFSLFQGWGLGHPSADPRVHQVVRRISLMAKTCWVHFFHFSYISNKLNKISLVCRRQTILLCNLTNKTFKRLESPLITFAQYQEHFCSLCLSIPFPSSYSQFDSTLLRILFLSEISCHIPGVVLVRASPPPNNKYSSFSLH